MEREILFRGKRVDNGEWAYGGYVPENSVILGYFEINSLDTDCDLIKCKAVVRKVKRKTVGQFTSLTDKNGVKIFEGDILKCNNNPKDIVQVVFGKFPVIDIETESEVDKVIGWYCNVIPTDALSRTRPFCLPKPLTNYYINRCNMEVFDNIHDNPELLKGD